MTTSQQSWVVHVKDVRPRRRTKVNTPVINTYSAQIHRCAELYSKLITDHPQRSYPLSSVPCSRSRDHYLHYVDLKPSGARSAPPWCRRYWEPSRADSVITRGESVGVSRDGVNSGMDGVNTRVDGANSRGDIPSKIAGNVNTRGEWVIRSGESVNNRGQRLHTRAGRVAAGAERTNTTLHRSNVIGVVSDTTGTSSELTPRENNDRVGPMWLAEHLRSRDCGAPVNMTLPHVQENTRTLPPGVHARVLPRNPSVREKIRGRARLDYEMANIKAEAFCEQQREKYFRTASANLRNRDVRFQEEELREQIRREQGDGEDDIISIVTSPLDQEELYSRIQSWIEDVQGALKHST
ncbi:uncharacterized protein LOC124267526 [Haliotis rubra]|uniref:uncharacterized protein LOC124267526 n=1 Tax=Haliotis rubra TaxID=36100 RepID=UPI001EE52EE9|nr:uncharacterized protein LOC124267526 [Haliotis rubra]